MNKKSIEYQLIYIIIILALILVLILLIYQWKTGGIDVVWEKIKNLFYFGT